MNGLDLTPSGRSYSTTVVDKLRKIPFSRWDSDLKLRHVPFRSYDDLRQAKLKARSAERKCRHYPLANDDLPPVGRLVAISYGIVIFTDITGELVDLETVAEFYPGATEDDVWGLWRKPTLDELIGTWPSKTAAPEGAEWWQPTIEELRQVRRAARWQEAKRLAP
ncbi:hypothetical protein GR210_08770 [Rhizobium leguminosarum]|nr:hypothetical protein [Rhizobium leguminosarum]MBY5325919.1 hypothetical protein [Rhizobium leguminosarum]NEH48889.1 hypothetical protein [Rhizobium leguminosarum]